MSVRTVTTTVLALALAGGTARAAAPLSGDRTRVVEETALVVWDGGVEHLFFAASADTRAEDASLVVGLPAGATLAEHVSGIEVAFAKLGREGSRLLAPSDGKAELVTDAAGLASFCAARPCTAPVRAWSSESLGRDGRLLVLGLAPREGRPTTRYAHVRMSTAQPLVPFGEPELARRDESVVPVDDAHPPRVKLWLELGTETKSGAWERRMDETLASTTPALVTCYAAAAEKSPRLAGDLHVQLRLPVAGPITAEGERASSKALSAVAMCFERALEKAAWPAPPGMRAAPLEVHALVRPPTASPRVLRAMVLASHDVEPRLGPRGEAAVPDGRVVESFEPTPRALRDAFDEPTLRALGVDLSRRYRLVVIESSSDARPIADDIVFRTIAPLPPAKPGETALPIVERGDAPTVAAPPARRRGWGRRGVRWVAALGLAALVGAAVYVGTRKT